MHVCVVLAAGRLELCRWTVACVCGAGVGRMPGAGDGLVRDSGLLVPMNL
jgi:hypothetical protein